MPHAVVVASSPPQTNTANKTSSSESTVVVSNAAGAGTPPAYPAQNGNMNGTGCLVCGTNDNEEQILLCEHCDGEYHTYCVQLNGIPEGEWFCDKCKSDDTDIKEDGLDVQVAALPPSITSQYGQIVWAQGGQSYGWWPAIIYDPRQTVEPARSQTRKHLRSKHLCYFYQCEESPFSILPPKKIKDWIEGLAEDFHLGKAAKSHGKQRYNSFLRAMEVACLELEKPVQERLEWEHTTSAAVMEQQHQQRMLSPSPNKRTSDLMEEDAAVKKHKRSASKSSESSGRNRAANIDLPTSNGVVEKGTVGRPMRSRTGSSSSPALQSGVVPDDSELVCTIKYLDAAAAGPLLSGVSGHSIPENKAVGFIVLKSRQTSTFRDARAAINDELMGDSLPAKLKWRFYVPRLGPVALKQEAILVMIQFTGYPAMGNSYQNPLILYVMGDDAEE